MEITFYCIKKYIFTFLHSPADIKQLGALKIDSLIVHFVKRQKLCLFH